MMSTTWLAHDSSYLWHLLLVFKHALHIVQQFTLVIQFCKCQAWCQVTGTLHLYSGGQNDCACIYR